MELNKQQEEELAKDRFISSVMFYSEKYPEMQSRIIQAMSHGTQKAIQKANDRATDMETIAVAFSTMANSRYSKSNHMWANGLILSKLKNWDKTDARINWASNIEKTEEYLKDNKLIEDK